MGLIGDAYGNHRVRLLLVLLLLNKMMMMLLLEVCLLIKVSFAFNMKLLQMLLLLLLVVMVMSGEFCIGKVEHGIVRDHAAGSGSCNWRVEVLVVGMVCHMVVPGQAQSLVGRMVAVADVVGVRQGERWRKHAASSGHGPSSQAHVELGRVQLELLTAATLGRPDSGKVLVVVRVLVLKLLLLLLVIRKKRRRRAGATHQTLAGESGGKRLLVRLDAVVQVMPGQGRSHLMVLSCVVVVVVMVLLAYTHCLTAHLIARGALGEIQERYTILKGNWDERIIERN